MIGLSKKKVTILANIAKDTYICYINSLINLSHSYIRFVKHTFVSVSILILVMRMLVFWFKESYKI